MPEWVSVPPKIPHTQDCMSKAKQTLALSDGYEKEPKSQQWPQQSRPRNLREFGSWVALFAGEEMGGHKLKHRNDSSYVLKGTQ